MWRKVFWDNKCTPENTPVIQKIVYGKRKKLQEKDIFDFMSVSIEYGGSPFSSESGEVYFFTLFSYGDANYLLLLESSDYDLFSLVWAKKKTPWGCLFLMERIISPFHIVRERELLYMQYITFPRKSNFYRNDIFL
jgi:hypothetical protein